LTWRHATTAICGPWLDRGFGHGSYRGGALRSGLLRRVFRKLNNVRLAIRKQRLLNPANSGPRRSGLGHCGLPKGLLTQFELGSQRALGANRTEFAIERISRSPATFAAAVLAFIVA
jgi:hypothetical protein